MSPYAVPHLTYPKVVTFAPSKPEIIPSTLSEGDSAFSDLKSSELVKCREDVARSPSVDRFSVAADDTANSVQSQQNEEQLTMRTSSGDSRRERHSRRQNNPIIVYHATTASDATSALSKSCRLPQAQNSRQSIINDTSKRPKTIVGVPTSQTSPSPYATAGLALGVPYGKMSDVNSARKGSSSMIGVSSVVSDSKEMSLRRRIRYVDEEKQQARSVTSPSSSVSPRMHQVC